MDPVMAVAVLLMVASPFMAERAESLASGIAAILSPLLATALSLEYIPDHTAYEAVAITGLALFMLNLAVIITRALSTIRHGREGPLPPP